MLSVKSIIVASAAPEYLNSNASINGYIARGFEEYLPEAVVHLARSDTLEASVRAYRPDIVLLVGSALPPVTNFANIRDVCDKTGAKLVFWLFDDPYEYDAHVKVLPFADAIFVNDSWSAWHYAAPCPVFHLPLAACPVTHRRPLGKRTGCDVFFCGVSFPNRDKLLRELQPTLAKVKTEVFGDGWDLNAFSFARNARIANDVLPLYYASSGLVLNVGRRFWLANECLNLAPTTPGPRTFEAAMAGAAQVFHVEGLEIEDYYRPGSEILLFDTAKDFQRIVEQAQDDPEFSQRVGKAAQIRSLSDHTYARRAQTILDLLDRDARASA